MENLKKVADRKQIKQNGKFDKVKISNKNKMFSENREGKQNIKTNNNNEPQKNKIK